MKYIKNDKMIFLSLDKGEEINSSIIEVANLEKIKSCWINGIGAITNVDVRYFNIEKKIYENKIYKSQYELTSLMGNISINKGEPFVHNHITFSDNNYRTIGGHLFSATITAAGEFCLFLSKDKIARDFDDEVGLSLWCL
tara:strand:- start:720 stop:1139 length:420 start_codon:yes stop_codon:yes gene_type:complete